ncbi:MAG: hypothetical protein QM647_05240 [Asticcacaulis sp.]|uniref:hypothetical protein n=1 Tax=Asticcacaulis sp. TaxID=1872648 RepID=UPI0039E2F249
MKYVRGFLVLVVLAYVAWIAFPVVKAFLFPAVDNGPTISARSMDTTDYSGGFDSPMTGSTATPSTDSIQGDTAVTAIATDNKPVVWLWGAVITLYLLAAFLHANGNFRAAFIYMLGFAADLILTYLTNGDKSLGIADKLFTVLSGWDPRYTLTLVALVLGFFIYMSRFRPIPRAGRTALSGGLS